MQALLLILLGVGCALVYLSHKNQGWLDKNLSAGFWRWLGYGLTLLALLGWLNIFSPAAALMSWTVFSMLFFGIFPYLVLLRAPKGVTKK